MFARITQSKLTIPLAVTAAGLGFYVMSARQLSNEAQKVFKGDDQWVDLKLTKKTKLTHDTSHYTFDFGNKDAESGLITASCVLTKYVTAKGNNVIRPYTPVSDPSQKGTVDFIIKTYEQGKMSKHIDELKEGDTLSFKGPIVKWKWEPNQFDSVALIGGGTGITPLWQLLHTIASNPADKTKVQLFYGSQSVDDIIARKEIDEIAAAHPDQVQVFYYIDNGKDDASKHIFKGYINKEALQKNLPGPSPKLKVFVCGPPGLYKAISGAKVSPTDQGEVSGILGELGYTKDNVFKL